MISYMTVTNCYIILSQLIVTWLCIMEGCKRFWNNNVIPHINSIVVTTSLKMTNSILSKIIGKVSHGNHKRTWQGVPDELLSYLYNI